MHLRTVTLQSSDAELLNPGNVEACASESAVLFSFNVCGLNVNTFTKGIGKILHLFAAQFRLKTHYK